MAKWQTDGSPVLSGATFTDQGVAVKPDSTWSVVGVGDFNGN
jgi:hypothetical protein